MNVQAAKVRSLQSKVSLAIVIIRNKPNDVELEDYINILRTNFIKSYKRNSDIISTLKMALLDAKIEIFTLKNNIEPNSLENVDFKLSSSKSFASVCESNNDSIVNNLEFADQLIPIRNKYEKNIDFIINIAKLKSLKKDFRVNEISNDEILKCLDNILSEISYFLFDETAAKMKFPFESILHGIQQFLNIFEIEWLYYLRNNLLSSISKFIDSLVFSILKYSHEKKVDELEDLNVYCNILFIMSTSDYMLNNVLSSITKGLNNAIEYILIELANDPNKKDDLSIWNLIDNCKFIIDTIDSIVKMRLLNNYAPISNQVKSNLNNILNNLFIKLTDVYSELAISLSKIIQLLAL